MEHESHHNHHPHGTGTRWLDLTLAISATIVSLVSLWLGLHSSHSMEKLVTANSYPYLESMRSTMENIPDSGRKREQVAYMFENDGSGPARIEWVELKFKDKPVTDLSALLDACCAAKSSDVSGLDRRGDMTYSLVRPGASLSMFQWSEPSEPNPVFNALRQQMNDIHVTVCYCSVFDECTIRRDDSAKPEPVAACKPPVVPFRPKFRED